MASLELDCKIALVTGGSKGIGAATARRLARDGARVMITYGSDEGAAADVVAGIRAEGGTADAVGADLMRTDVAALILDAVESAFGTPDILVLAAGTTARVPLTEIDVDHYAAMFDLNVRGALLLAAETARRMNEGGRIVYVSSAASRLASGGNGVYAASKAAVEALVRNQAVDLGPRRITVNAVAPGPIDTALLEAGAGEFAPRITALGRLGQPEDVADAIRLLTSDDARWITGQTIDVDGGLHFF